MERVELAFRQAVHTSHAARIVDAVVLDVDARGLAVLLAFVAVLAAVGVDDGAEQREARHQAQHRSHGADGAAPRATAAKGKEPHHDKRGDGDDERDAALEPHVDLIEGIAAGTLGKAGKYVVEPQADRLQEVGGYAAIGAVRGYEYGYRVESEQHKRDEKHEQRVAQPAVLADVVEAALLDLAGNEVETVLHHAQRTHNRAVEAPEEQGDQQDEGHYDEVAGQHCRQELHLGHPAEIVVQHS